MGDAKPYVPDYDHDVFVSYAHVDDKPEPGADVGWVTTFVRGLRNRLAQRLGRADGYKLWMDHELSRHSPFSDEIQGALEKTATLLVVLSPGYVASAWCQRETDAFLRAVQARRRGDSRIFVVERMEVNNGERPEAFGGLLGYKFWVQEREGRAPRTLGDPDPRERPYIDMLNDLSHDLAEELKRLRQGAKPATTAEPPAATVFLAEVTDDIDDLRNSARRYFTQANLEVLPQSYYSRDPQAFREEMMADLGQAKLYVQLLSELTGKRTPDLPRGYLGLQLELAEEAGLPILQWRSPELDPEAVEDEAHRKVLDGQNVMAVELEEFKREVVEQAKRKQEKVAEPINAFIFVDMEQGDRKLAESVCAVLDERQVGYALPLRQGSPSEVRQDLKRNIGDCDALIVIYGKSPVSWVREQLSFVRKTLHERNQPLKVLAIYEGPPPPPDKAPVDYKLPGIDMATLHGYDGLDESEIEQFLARVA